MDTTIAARPRGKRVILMLDHLLSKPEGATAAELSMIAGVESRQVYPLLAWWAKRGIIDIFKIAGYNVYRIAPRYRRILNYILRVILNTRTVRAVEIVKRLAEHKLLRRLTRAEIEILALLVERLVSSSSPYLRIRADNPVQAIDILRVKIHYRLSSLGLDPKTISQALLEIEDAIEELHESGIVYIHWDKRSSTLVLRLDKSLEEQLASLL